MSHNLSQMLLPSPWSVEMTEGEYVLAAPVSVDISTKALPLFCAVSESWPGSPCQDWTLGEDDSVGHWLAIGDPDLPEASIEPESYRLTVTEDGIALVSWTAEGFRHGVGTLLQIVSSCGRTLPYVEIQDAPENPIRPVTVAVAGALLGSKTYCRRLFEDISRYKLNELQISGDVNEESFESLLELGSAAGVEVSICGGEIGSVLSQVPNGSLLEIAVASESGWSGKSAETSQPGCVLALVQFGLRDTAAAELLARLADCARTDAADAAWDVAGLWRISKQRVLVDEYRQKTAGLAQEFERLSSQVQFNHDQFDCQLLAALLIEHLAARRYAACRVAELVMQARQELSEPHSAASGTSLEAAAHLLTNLDKDRENLCALMQSNLALYTGDAAGGTEGYRQTALYGLFGQSEGLTELREFASQLEQAALHPEHDVLAQILPQESME